MPFADLLQFLEANLSTGTLQIRKGRIVKMIFYEKGKIISTSSSDPKEYLGHFLVSQEYITEEELRIAMDIQRNSKMLLGKILVVGGKISEPEITEVLKQKAHETIYSIFLWEEGEFRFYDNEFISRLFLRISLNSQALIMEGMLRRDEWRRIRQVFPHNNIVLEKVPHTYVEGDELNARTMALYGLVDGQKSIEDLVLVSHASDYHVCQALFRLYGMGVVRIKKILAAPGGPLLKGGDFSMSQLLELGKESLKKGRYGEAVDFLREIPAETEQYRDEVAPLLAEAESNASAEIYAHSLPPGRPLRLLKELHQIEMSTLTPQEGFLLSRIDGTWDVTSILSVTPLNEYDALRLLKKLLDQGIVGC